MKEEPANKAYFQSLDWNELEIVVGNLLVPVIFTELQRLRLPLTVREFPGILRAVADSIETIYGKK